MYVNLQKFIDYDQKTIIAADFNMIENLFLDRIGGNPNKTHTIGFETFKAVKNKLNLIDIWKKIIHSKKALLIIMQITQYIVDLIGFI